MNAKHLQLSFSLIELVFVIAVVGILAALAIPKLSATRNDAMYAAIHSDIQAIISSAQVSTITHSTNALNGSTLIQAAGLSQARWVAQGNGIRLGKNGVLDKDNNCVIIDIVNQILQIQITPLAHSHICQKLSQSYPTPLHVNLTSSLF